MSTVMTLQIDSTSSDATVRLGEQLGKRLKGSEVIELLSDVGGGKTTLVRGLVRGAGSHDNVASPSFTVSKLYQAEKLTIHHFDFYRMQDPGLLENALQEVVGDPLGVVVIEWGEIVARVLPEKRLTIRIQTTGESSRHISLAYPAELAYLVEGL